MHIWFRKSRSNTCLVSKSGQVKSIYQSAEPVQILPQDTEMPYDARESGDEFSVLVSLPCPQPQRHFSRMFPAQLLFHTQHFITGQPTVDTAARHVGPLRHFLLRRRRCNPRRDGLRETPRPRSNKLCTEPGPESPVLRSASAAVSNKLRAPPCPRPSRRYGRMSDPFSPWNCIVTVEGRNDALAPSVPVRTIESATRA